MKAVGKLCDIGDLLGRLDAQLRRNATEVRLNARLDRQQD